MSLKIAQIMVHKYIKNVTMMSIKMVMLSDTLTAEKMKSKSMLFTWGIMPVTNDVKWLVPAPVKVLVVL